MPVLPDKIQVFANLLGVWTDISDFCFDKISGNWGLIDSSPINRLAAPGFMKIFIDNESGDFTPNTTNKLRGWRKGTQIKLVVTFLGEDSIKFLGQIDDFAIESDTTYGIKTVIANISDWMQYSIKYPLPAIPIATNQRGDEVLTTILSKMPIPPKDTAFDQGESTFEYAFDSITSRSVAYSEFNKVALSEVGYIYLTKPRKTGETLVFENATNRNGLEPLNKIPKIKANSGFLLAEDGSFLLAEDGSRIISNEADTFHAQNIASDISIAYGENLVNQFRVKVYPKRIDSSTQVLFSLDKPMLIPATATVKFTGTFANASSGGEINGINMFQPVSGSDWLVNLKADGTGTDISSSCTVTAVYGSQSADFSITNSYAQHGYLIKLQSRGNSVQSINNIETIVENSASIENYGVQPANFEQKYQNTLNKGVVAANTFLSDVKDDNPVLDSITFSANDSEYLMNAFLYLDIGAKVWISESKAGIDSYYYIQSISFEMTKLGIINFTWKLLETNSLEKGLSLAEIHIRPESKDAINYGYLPRVSNLYKRTYTCWIKADNEAVGSPNPKYVMGVNSDYAGCALIISSPRGFRVYAKSSTWPGQWSTPDGLWTPGVWFFVAVTRDISSNPNNSPLIYFNGVSQPITQDITPTGTYRDETGSYLVLGNGKTNSIDYTYPMNGSIKDARIYNRILSVSEISSLYAGNEITDGLVFQGPTVKTNEAEFYNNQVLDAEMKLSENIYGAIGTTNGNPTCKIV